MNLFMVNMFRKIQPVSRKFPLVFVVFTALFASFAIASSGGGEHGAEVTGWLITDSYRVMNFAVLAAGLFFLLRKPATEFFKSRTTDIEKQLSELNAKKNAAEVALAEYNEKLALLENETDKIVAQYIEQGEASKKRILEEAKKAAVKLEEQAQRNIAYEFGKAKKQLQDEVISQALDKAEEIVKKSISSDDQEKLVDEYLGKVA